MSKVGWSDTGWVLAGSTGRRSECVWNVRGLSVGRSQDSSSAKPTAPIHQRTSRFRRRGFSLCNPPPQGANSPGGGKGGGAAGALLSSYALPPDVCAVLMRVLCGTMARVVPSADPGVNNVPEW